MADKALAINEIEPQEVLVPADPMISMIERVAMDPDADLEKLERMLELKKQHDEQNAKAQFAAAFSRASAQFPTIPLNGKGHNDKPYATLKDITALTRPVLSEHGLALSFSVEVGDAVVVTAELMHQAGYSKTTSIDLPKDASGSKNAVQAVGSSQTYGQRYTAQAILGLSLGDDTEDDGRSSGQPQRPPISPKSDTWEATVIQDLPEGSTPREVASTIAAALCAQFKRKKSEKQLFNEWDRRVHLIEGSDRLEGKHPDLHEMVCDAYEMQLMELKETS